MYRSSRCSVERVKRPTLTPFQALRNAAGDHPGGVTAVGGYNLTTLDPDGASTARMGVEPSIRDGAFSEATRDRCIVDAVPLSTGHAEHGRRAVLVHEKHTEDRTDG
ncbi:hypothetical protein SAMN05216588_12454 [Pseudomonas flavescens]|uniref:Uncharacterized protein n=1 Tax=Phytopseudomonas flavescens TaxID=29435 RepID=A0A1G8NB22_9GAMM|nr:hypothetical protein [Pseudomonas flavescens]SDI77454.1 hypothetical protein SAMN05216588_12454 [Pseudomonas flavescens]